jgi:hypothetical protein
MAQGKLYRQWGATGNELASLIRVLSEHQHANIVSQKERVLRKQRLDKSIGVNGLKVVQGLAGADEFDGQVWREIPLSAMSGRPARRRIPG